MGFVQRIFIACAFLLLPFAGPCLAADGPKPLFAGDEVINLTLSGPVADLPRTGDAKPMPGVLKVDGASAESLPVMLSTRGITRRKKQICAFPPLRLEFTEKPGKTSLFRGQKRLKLVTHCQSAERFEQGLLLEYSAYRLYRSLTPESFNARLARINYVDETGRPIATRFGFFLEDIDDVARRNGQERLRGVNHIAIDQQDRAAATRFGVFQYMISNLDWSMTSAVPGDDCCHNSRLVGAKGATTGLVAVPYDFDYSGLVDAPYAVPPDGIRLANVRVRRYRGFCRDNSLAQAYALDLQAHRTEMLAIVDQIPQLSGSSRSKADEYLGDFLARIGEPAKMAEMLGTCLTG